MLDIILLVVILLSLSVILSIVVRKFSILANLDVANMRAEREARFKEQIISNRLKRNYRKFFMQISHVFKPVSEAVARFFVNFYKKLINIKEEKEREIEVNSGEPELNSIDQLFYDAEEATKVEDYAGAEKKYIEIISLDSKNFLAFKKLGRVYYDKKDYVEARQTLEHALRLTENLSAIPDNSTDENYPEVSTQISGMYFDLALISQAVTDYESALLNIEKALSLEPNNPRYLDTKFDIAIILKNKKKAEEALVLLKKTNPDNQKLDELDKMVNNLTKD